MTEQRRTASTELQQRFGLTLSPGETPQSVYPRHLIVLIRRTLGLSVALIVPIIVLLWLLTRPEPAVRPGWGFIIVLLFYVGVILLLFVYFFIDWRNDALILTDQRLIHVELVILISQAQREAALRNVQNVRFEVPGLLARLLGYGDIEIETAARGEDISFGPIRNPEGVQKEIMSLVQAIRAESSTQLMQETLLHRLDPDRYPPPQPALPSKEEGQGRPPGLIFVPFRPIVEGDTITWHKHWFFLILRLSGPLLLLVLLVVVAFLSRHVEAGLVAWLVWAGFLLFDFFYWIWNYQLWLGDVYVLTADSIHDVYRTPFRILGESRRSAGLERIQNISFQKPGLLAYLLNFGNVRIQTAGEEEFTFSRVPRPEQVQRAIYRRQEAYRQRQEQRERDQIAEWLITFRKLDGQLRRE